MDREQLQDKVHADNLEALGAAVRRYDDTTVERLRLAAKELHWELCKLDTKNAETWEGVTVYDFVNAWVSTPYGNGARLVGRSPKVELWHERKSKMEESNG